MAKYKRAQEDANRRTRTLSNRGYKARVSPAIDELEDNIKREVLAAYRFQDDDGNVDLDRRRRIKGKTTTVGENLRRSVGRTYTRGKKKVDAGMLGVSGNAYKTSAAQLNFIMATVTSTNIPMPTKTQFFTARFTTVGGLKITDRLNLNTDKEKERLIRIIFQGLGEGQSPQQMSRTISQAFGLTRSNATRIVRTESARMQNLGHTDQTERIRNFGIDTRRQIISVLDDRTRSQSAQVDGQIETIPEGETLGYFIYPGGVRVVTPGSSGVARWDINDREATIDLLINDDTGEPVEPAQRRARDIPVGEDPRGRTVNFNNVDIPFQRFDEWAKGKGLTRNRYGELLFP